MIDLIQVQRDVFGLLMSAPQLATVNLVEERQFIVQSEIEMDAVWQTVRNGRSGCGILIEEPDVISDSPNVSGPVQSVELSFVCFQNGDAAFGDLGSGLFAAQMEQFILDILHQQCFTKWGTIQVQRNFSSPARDYPGINARRVKLVVTPKGTAQTPRTAIVTVTVAGGNATLACATAGSAIYYTLDGSFPSNPAVAIKPLSVTDATPAGEPVNPNSTLYAAPFAAPSGTLIRAAAWLAGYNAGQIIDFTVP